MALINRVARLMTADLHAVLDRLEEPDVLLRQAIREMAEALERSTAHARVLEQELERLADRRQRASAAAAELAAQLAICFDAGNEDLARKLVKRKLETERLVQHIGERHAALAKELHEREQALAAQREQLDVLRQKADLLIEPAATHAGDSSTPSFAVGDDEVEVAFLRERQRRARS